MNSSRTISNVLDAKTTGKFTSDRMARVTMVLRGAAVAVDAPCVPAALSVAASSASAAVGRSEVAALLSITASDAAAPAAPVCACPGASGFTDCRAGSGAARDDAVRNDSALPPPVPCGQQPRGVEGMREERWCSRRQRSATDRGIRASSGRRPGGVARHNFGLRRQYSQQVMPHVSCA